MHWHAHALSALTWSADGTFLISGGEEMVLVIWQIETMTQQFLPRLGEAILTIATENSGTTYGCVCADNAIRLIDSASMENKQSIQGVYQASRSISTGVMVDPRRAAAVFSGRAGTLQFFDYRADCVLGELEVTGQNVVSRTNDEKIAYFHVEHSTFSPCGNHLITAEQRERTSSNGIQQPSTLKFWHYEPTEARFVQNTRSDCAHKGHIAAVAHHPRLAIAATAGEDGTFKLWRLTEELQQVQNGQLEGARPMWECQSVGSWQPGAPSALAFSQDGSLLAVAYGAVVTLWDPNTVSLQCTLPQADDVLNILFVPSSSLLAVLTEKGLFVWNLLTCSLWWSYAAQALAIATHPSRAGLALLATVPAVRAAESSDEEEPDRVATSQYLVILFGDASSAAPSALWRIAHPTNAICFVPAGNTWGAVDMARKSPMYILALGCSSELSLVGTEQPTVTPLQEEAVQQNHSAFEAAFGSAPDQTTGERPAAVARTESAPRQQSRNQAELFDGTPTHVMPPLTKLFSKYMSQMLPEKQEMDEEIADNNGLEEDDGNTYEDRAPDSAEFAQLGLEQLKDPDTVYQNFTKYFQSAE